MFIVVVVRRFLTNKVPSADLDESTMDISDKLAEAVGADLQTVRRSAQNVCFVSGLQSKDVPEERWVAVPDEYMTALTSSNEADGEQSRQKRSHVALEHCMRQLITARQL